MDYHKYLKYKNKYLQLKEKLQQLGGAIYRHDRKRANDTEETILRTQPKISMNPPNNYAKDSIGINIILVKNEEVIVNEMCEDTDTTILFGKVVKNGITGWVNMEYLHQKIARALESSFFATYLSKSKSSRVEKRENELSSIGKAINEAFTNPSITYEVSIVCNHSNDKLRIQEKTYLEIDPNNLKKDHTKDSCFLINGDKVKLSQILKVKSSDMLFGYVIKETDSHCNGWVNIENLETEDSSFGWVKLTELAKTPGGRAM